MLSLNDFATDVDLASVSPFVAMDGSPVHPFANTHSTARTAAHQPPSGRSHAGAGNRPGPRPAPRPHVALVVVLLLILVSFAIVLAGCTAAQETGAGTNLTKAAADGQAVSTFLVGSPTTQPSPMVGVVEAAAPITAPYITAAGTAVAIVSAGLGALGTWLSTKGTIASLATSVVDHQAAIAEVVGDVKNWNSPTVSFTAKTEKIVADAAGIVAAAPASATAITDLTISPRARDGNASRRSRARQDGGVVRLTDSATQHELRRPRRQAPRESGACGRGTRRRAASGTPNEATAMDHTTATIVEELRLMDHRLATRLHAVPAASHVPLPRAAVEDFRNLCRRMAARLLREDTKMGQAAKAIAQLQSELTTAQEDTYDAADLAAIESVLSPPPTPATAGGAGTDTTAAGAGADTTVGGAGTDTTAGGTGADTTVAGSGADTTGDASNDSSGSAANSSGDASNGSSGSAS